MDNPEFSARCYEAFGFLVHDFGFAIEESGRAALGGRFIVTYGRGQSSVRVAFDSYVVHGAVDERKSSPRARDERSDSGADEGGMGVEDRDWMRAPREERDKPPARDWGGSFWNERLSFWQATWLVFVAVVAVMLVHALTGEPL